MVLGMAMLPKGQTVVGPLLSFSICSFVSTVESSVLKRGTEIHGAQRRNPEDSGDPLTFLFEPLRLTLVFSE